MKRVLVLLPNGFELLEGGGRKACRPRFPAKELLPYIIAQVPGAVAAAHYPEQEEASE